MTSIMSTRRRAIPLVVVGVVGAVVALAGCVRTPAPQREATFDAAAARAVVARHVELNNAANAALSDDQLARFESGPALRVDLASYRWRRSPHFDDEPIEPFTYDVEQVWIAGRKVWPRWFVALARSRPLPGPTASATPTATPAQEDGRSLLLFVKDSADADWTAELFARVPAELVTALPRLAPDADGVVPSVAGSGIPAGPVNLSQRWAQVLDGQAPAVPDVVGPSFLAEQEKARKRAQKGVPRRWATLPGADRSFALTTADGGELRFFTTVDSISYLREREDTGEVWLLNSWAALAGIAEGQHVGAFSVRWLDQWVAAVPPPGAGPATVLGRSGGLVEVTATVRPGVAATP